MTLYNADMKRPCVDVYEVTEIPVPGEEGELVWTASPYFSDINEAKAWITKRKMQFDGFVYRVNTIVWNGDDPFADNYVEGVNWLQRLVVQEVVHGEWEE